jgi:CelD/BcsL family acetyltransferase involved in cellulose biosynthesis
MEDLLQRRPERLPFLHPVWLQTWLSEFGGACEPLLITAANEQAIGVAPLMRADERVTFIGDANICDFMDFLIEPGHTAAAYDDIWRQLCDEDWPELDLWGLMETSPTREAIALLAKESGYECDEREEAVAPRLALPSSWDEYLASLNKKDRHELRRKIRRAFDSGAAVTFDCYSTQAQVAASMDEFLDLHTRSRQDKTDFMTEDMELFFRRMASALAAAGLVRLFMLRVNARPAAAVLCFDAGSHLYLYNSGYDPDYSGLSVGLVSKALCLRWAIENGKQGLDFLRGDEPYKYDLGAVDQRVFRLRVRR